MSIESVMPSNCLILCHPLLLPPSIFTSIRVFSNESALSIRSKYWSFSFHISPSNEHPGLMSFRMDWVDLLPVQGTLKSLLQHHSSKASILWCSKWVNLRCLALRNAKKNSTFNQGKRISLFINNKLKHQYQFSSVAQLCPTFCNPMNCSTPSLPVHYQPPEFTQTHVHWVSDAIQPSPPCCPLLLLIW